MSRIEGAWRGLWLAWTFSSWRKKLQSCSRNTKYECISYSQLNRSTNTFRSYLPGCTTKAWSFLEEASPGACSSLSWWKKRKHLTAKTARKILTPHLDATFTALTDICSLSTILFSPTYQHINSDNPATLSSSGMTKLSNYLFKVYLINWTIWFTISMGCCASNRNVAKEDKAQSQTAKVEPGPPPPIKKLSESE